MAGEPEVFAAGTVNADFVMGVECPLERGTSLIAGRLLRTSGGRAANAAVMARRLEASARLFGCVGTGELAAQALAGPRAASVDTAGIRTVAMDTGIAMVVVGDHGSKTMVFAPGANDAFRENDGDRLARRLSDASAGSVLVVDSEVSPPALVTALTAARRCGLPTVVDPTRPAGLDRTLLELADHLTPNAHEAAQIAGGEVDAVVDAERAARQIRGLGPRHVHVRLPRGGCFSAWAEGEALVLPPADVEPVDTTGAGDAFAGTLAATIAAGRPILEAVRLAVAAATCAVTAFGAQESYPDRFALAAMARRVRVTAHA